MASSRSSVSLDAVEIEEFLTSNMKVQVATIGPDGAPHLTTLFYVVEQGQIAFWTYGASQKVVNLRRDPRISCLVEDGEDYFELRGVSIQGTARLVEDYEDIGDEIVDKQARKRVGVIVEPVKVASWDHRKMHALPGEKGGSG
jgi:PPOX class probable F420-dependent enzyme